MLGVKLNVRFLEDSSGKRKFHHQRRDKYRPTRKYANLGILNTGNPKYNRLQFMGFAVKYDSAYEYEHVVMVSVPSTPKVVLNYSTRVAHIHCPRRLKSINNNIVAQRFVSHARPLYSFACFVQNHQFIMHDTCNWVKILFFVLLCSPKK